MSEDTMTIDDISRVMDLAERGDWLRRDLRASLRRVAHRAHKTTFCGKCGYAFDEPSGCKECERDALRATLDYAAMRIDDARASLDDGRSRYRVASLLRQAANEIEREEDTDE